MRIALYSEPSRDAIDDAKEIIKKKSIGNSDQDIREFRQNAKKLLKSKTYEKILNYLDFYTLPECRDLLFHVHDDAFDLPRIKAYLDHSGLNFSGFYVSDVTLANYRALFAADPDATNLDNWMTFESLNPDIFMSMYRFWLKKT